MLSMCETPSHLLLCVVVQNQFLLQLGLTKKLKETVFDGQDVTEDDGQHVDAGDDDPYKEERPKKKAGQKRKSKAGDVVVAEDPLETCRCRDMTSQDCRRLVL